MAVTLEDKECYTLLTRTCVAQTKSTFLKLAGPQQVHMSTGDGSKLVRDAFELAKENRDVSLFTIVWFVAITCQEIMFDDLFNVKLDFLTFIWLLFWPFPLTSTLMTDHALRQRPQNSSPGWFASASVAAGAGVVKPVTDRSAERFHRLIVLQQETSGDLKKNLLSIQNKRTALDTRRRHRPAKLEQNIPSDTSYVLVSISPSTATMDSLTWLVRGLNVPGVPLCCDCGTPLKLNPSNMCRFFLLTHMDITANCELRALPESAERVGPVQSGVEETSVAVMPVKVTNSKKLISHDIHSNSYNYKYSYALDVVPISEGSLVFLGNKLHKTLGYISPITKKANSIHLIDPSGRVPSRRFATPSKWHQREHDPHSVPPGSPPQSGRFRARAEANINNASFEKLRQHSMPVDVNDMADPSGPRINLEELLDDMVLDDVEMSDA
ncbi:nonsense-mediated mRNA decay protein [Culex quinquefasciatus]|uniref:Nonsense-mediated mRNA decay protein n=1 Tax=Culex quinquefasciatus TaxID=7176 RepID=B0X0V6_CULQU|nr:nonsense-mediated mRNA decay protein [Culex quinquefasciatus]|eukprot:XP_001863278.1 nonsense-mediated mRNA decay protein [Culex quinquefasciatus]